MVSLYKGDADLQVAHYLLSFFSQNTEKSNNTNFQATYLKEEYTLDLTISKLAVPYVAIMDGITMGGGCGISVNGRYFMRRDLHCTNRTNPGVKVPCGDQEDSRGDA